MTTARPARRSTRLGIAMVAIVISLACSDPDSRPATRPNLVLLIADTLRQDYLGAYGFEGEISPALDRFGAHAILFENAISAAPWTKPSVVSIFTGLRPEAHGMTGVARLGSELFQSLHPEIPTLAEELRAAGYETAAFYSNAWLDPASGLDRGFDHYEKVDEDADVIAGRALEFLQSRTSDRPFFLYLHFMDAHGPYDCSKADFELLRDSPSLGTDRILTEPERTELRYLNGTQTPWLEDPDLRQTLRFWRACYAAGVARLDARLAELLTTLAAEPWIDDTAVVFSSDHGEALLDHGGSRFAQHPLGQQGWEHGWSLRFHQTRVPLLLRLPGGAEGGTRVQSIASTLDIMPTLLELAGRPRAATSSARSLLSIARGEDAAPRFVASSGVKMKDEMHSIQNLDYKLVVGSFDGPLDLFDLQMDPREMQDVSKRLPELAARLEKRAQSGLDQIATQLPATTKPVDPEVLEELRALGYVNE